MVQNTWEYVIWGQRSGMKEQIFSVDIAIAKVVSRSPNAKENISVIPREFDGDSHHIAIGKKKGNQIKSFLVHEFFYLFLLVKFQMNLQTLVKLANI